RRTVARNELLATLLGHGILLGDSGWKVLQPGSFVFVEAADQLRLRHSFRRQITKDLHEILGHEPLRPPEQQRYRTRWLVSLKVIAKSIERAYDVVAALDLADARGA